MVGKPIPSVNAGALSFMEEAQDLVFEAYNLSPKKAKQHIEGALLLDED